MKKLIEAFNIFLKYDKGEPPTHCEHDKLHVMIDPEIVSEEDKAALDALHFYPDTEFGNCFYSFYYGSA